MFMAASTAADLAAVFMAVSEAAAFAAGLLTGVSSILNSVYGKLAQFVGSSNKVPNCANPYYAAAITAYCSRRLIELAMVDPSAIVFFATDGILSTRPLHHLPIPIKGVKNCPAKRSGKRVKDESAGDAISLGDWEYACNETAGYSSWLVYMQALQD